MENQQTTLDLTVRRGPKKKRAAHVGFRASPDVLFTLRHLVGVTVTDYINEAIRAYRPMQAIKQRDGQ